MYCFMRRWARRGVALGLLLLAATPGASEAAGAPDSLTLVAPENVQVERRFNPVRRTFQVFITFDDIPDSCGTFIHQPDTTGWSNTSLPSEVTLPETRGEYSGDIDRTLSFRAVDGGVVGQGALRVQVAVRGEEFLNREIDLGAAYTPNTWFPLILRNSLTGQNVDYGIEMRFSDGNIDAQGQFLVGLEDFEGYHIWRGINADGSDLQVIGEVSKQEARLGGSTGGSLIDSLYFYEVVPALRSVGSYSFDTPADCLGRTLTLDLDANEMFWFDCNAFNGFTYYYLVTTFDRDYDVSSGRQGLQKFDNCDPVFGQPIDCPGALVEQEIEVDNQADIDKIYAVPNPFRSGGSRITEANYHNFPDDRIRFVNVPEQCEIKIFTVSGDLVWEYNHNSPSGNIEWDLRNGAGEAVASGVYIYRIEASGKDVLGRVVVIR